MAIALAALAFFVKLSSLAEVNYEKDEHDDTSIFSFARVVLGAIALFFYVGIEVIAGDTIGLYAQGLGVLDATSLTSYTMVFMVISYLVGVFFIPKYISQQKALTGSAILGIVLLIGVAFSSTTSHSYSEILWGWSGIMTLPNSVTFVALLGLANALVWPTIWPLALENLGSHTAKGSALLIMAIAGGAILPLAFGRISELSGDMQGSYLYGIICYLIILFYALKGHKMTSWKL
jgi:fucose permease